MSQKTILSIKKISKFFSKVIANNNVSFEVKKQTVHAILGENGAGKSTLVKILYGILKPDAGEILFDNKKLNIFSPAEARKLGIGMIFQHFSLFDSLSVRENLILGLDENISYYKLESKIEELVNKYNLILDLDAPITSLSSGEKQRVEIVRVLLQKPKILIMDEPTSVLTPQEVKNLFITLKSLINDGTTILYITHKLEEVISICDYVTIMRNGKVIDNSVIKNFTSKSLATKMLGKNLSDINIDYSYVKEETKFEVKSLSHKYNDPFYTDLKNISFKVNKGEIFGIAGVAGNGQSELMDILTGENKNIKTGNIVFKDKNINNLNPQERRNLSIAFVPENRLGHSAVPELSLIENTLLSRFPKNSFVKNGLINKKYLKKYSNNIIREYSVITSDADAKASSLSGGNLQKFVIGREILSNPNLLIISHPTWGIDAGAENFIRRSIIELSKKGTSVIVISQDLDELLEISHKLSVIYNGNLSRPFKTTDISKEKIGLLMGGRSE